MPAAVRNLDDIRRHLKAVFDDGELDELVRFAVDALAIARGPDNEKLRSALQKLLYG